MKKEESVVAQFDIEFPIEGTPGPSGVPVVDVSTGSDGGVFSAGPLSIASTIIVYFFAFIVLCWVAISAYAYYVIVGGQGEDSAIQRGFQGIKNMWWGFTMLVIFFVALSLLGSVFGVGNVWEWSESLAQCNGRGFYFTEAERQPNIYPERFSGVDIEDGVIGICCPANAGSTPLTDDPLNWWILPQNQIGLAGSYEAAGCKII